MSHPLFHRILPPDLRVGDSISGRVTVLAPFGAFVDLGRDPWIGLVHLINLTPEFRQRTPGGNVIGPAVGTWIEAIVLGRHEGLPQIHLSMTEAPGQAHEDWERTISSFAIGDMIIVDRMQWLSTGFLGSCQQRESGWARVRIDCSPELHDELRDELIIEHRPTAARIIGYDHTLLELIAEVVPAHPEIEGS